MNEAEHRPSIILSAPKRSGKTTALQGWVKAKEAAGFLTPDSPAGRCILNPLTGESLPFEASASIPDEQVYRIGRFRLLRSAFNAGENWIREGLRGNRTWLVMDEIGPLELEGKGFDALLKKTLASLKQTGSSSRLLIVVREELLPDVVSRYQLQADVATLDEIRATTGND